MEKTKEEILEACARKYNYEGLRELQHWDQHDKIELAAYDAMQEYADQFTQSLQAEVERLKAHVVELEAERFELLNNPNNNIL